LADRNAAGALCAALIIALFGDRIPRVKYMTIALLSYSIFLGGFTLARDRLPALLLTVRLAHTHVLLEPQLAITERS
jgi:hypothetical protein